MREDTDWRRPTTHHIIPVTSDSRVPRQLRGPPPGITVGVPAAGEQTGRYQEPTPWSPDKCVPEVRPPARGTQELGWRQAEGLEQRRHGKASRGGRSCRLHPAVRSLTFGRQGVSVPVTRCSGGGNGEASGRVPA